MRSIFLLLLLSICMHSFAQNGIHYQAVIRDAGGSILNNVPVNVKVTIQPSAGTAYTENISAMTNDYGILNLVIGQNGNMDLKDFNWEFGSATMDLEIEAGAKSILIEDQVIRSVPYAYHAQLAQSAINDEVDDADADPTNELQSLSYDSLTQSLMLSDGGVVQLSFEDKVEDADADPTNELQSLSYDSVSRTLMLSDGGVVQLPMSSSTFWTQSSEGIYSEEDAYIGQPSDSPHLRLNPSIIDFGTENGDSSSHWTAKELKFLGGNFENTMGADHVSLEGHVGPYTFTNKIDTSGFTSTLDIFNERSRQFGGNFTAVKLPDSNNVFSQMNTAGMVIRSGGLSTNLNIEHLGIGGQWPVDYARLFGGGYGRLELYNSDDQMVVDLDSESGGGILNLKGMGSDIQSHLTNNQLVFGEEGLGPYAFLSGNGYGQLNLYNGANWSAVELDAGPGPGEIRVNDGAGGADFTALFHNRLQIEEGDLYTSLQSERLELGSSLNGTIARLSNDNEAGRLEIYNSASWKIADLGEREGYGDLSLFDPSGRPQIELTNNLPRDGAGRINLYNENNSIFEVSTTDGGSGFSVLYGENTSLNVLLSHIGGDPDNGYMGIFDRFGGSQAFMYIDGNGDGRVVADVKNFKMEHPEKENTSIYYASLEGPEVAAYDRGTARLKNGRVKVTFSEHYKIVANPETMTVMLTPHSSDTYGLAVVEKTESGFVVEELKKGAGNFSFDWEVKCERRGYENWEVEQEDVQIQPLMRKQ